MCRHANVPMRVALWLAAASIWASPSLAQADANPALKTCRLPGLAQAARCGSVQRALDPSQPQGKQIEVHYAVVPALARHKAEDPVFFFAGGPGQSAVDLIGPLAARYSRLNQRRDLVFVDQRGTGMSAPLYCAEDDERAGLASLTESTDVQRRLQALRNCQQALQALPHGDLRHYTTTEAMADADAVRQALGVARIDAIGASYGTRAVLEYMRQFPTRVRRAVIDGVAPPDMRLPESMGTDSLAAMDALLAACAQEASCAKRHPQLASQWAGLLASLPLTVQLTHQVSGQLQPVRIERESLASMVRVPLYSPVWASALPMAIAEAASGRWGPLAALSGSMGHGPGSKLATGMHFSVVCAEDMPAAAPSVPPSASASANAFTASVYGQVCAHWPRGTVPAGFYSLPPAPAPTWLLSGGIDPVTPPRHAQRVAAALGPRARHIVVPNLGHGVSTLDCVREAITKFITTTDDAAALAVDAQCAAQVPRPPAFMQPGSTR
jgi:pimeloyl-ACP methyl ester carboxylesterase